MATSTSYQRLLTVLLISLLTIDSNSAEKSRRRKQQEPTTNDAPNSTSGGRVKHQIYQPNIGYNFPPNFALQGGNVPRYYFPPGFPFQTNDIRPPIKRPTFHTLSDKKNTPQEMMPFSHFPYGQQFRNPIPVNNPNPSKSLQGVNATESKGVLTIDLSRNNKDNGSSTTEKILGTVINPINSPQNMFGYFPYGNPMVPGYY